MAANVKPAGKVRGAKDAYALAPIPRDAKADDVVTVNFVEDGITAFAKVWYRGEELSLYKGSDDWKMTLADPEDADSSWLLLDENAQIDRWGVRMFRQGKWEGEGFDLDDPDLSDEDKKILASQNSLRAGITSVEEEVPKRRGPGRPPKAGSASVG